jgi:hypothetical protein
MVIMMKKIQFYILATSLAMSGAVFAHNAGTYKLHTFNIMNSKHNKVFDCGDLSDRTFTIVSSDRRHHLSKNYYLTKTRWHHSHLKNHVISLSYTATANVIADNGKKYKATDFGRSLGIRGDNVIYGVFSNRFCKGFFKAVRR